MLTCGKGQHHSVTEDEAKCETCPVGHYCPEDVEDPIICPAGSTNELLSAHSQEDCLPCPAGYYCSAEDSEILKVVCPVDTYCPEGSSEPVACPDGWLTEYEGAFNSNECLMCPLGMYMDSETSECITCPAHHYCAANADKP